MRGNTARTGQHEFVAVKDRHCEQKNDTVDALDSRSSPTFYLSMNYERIATLLPY